MRSLPFIAAALVAAGPLAAAQPQAGAPPAEPERRLDLDLEGLADPEEPAGEAQAATPAAPAAPEPEAAPAPPPRPALSAAEERRLVAAASARGRLLAELARAGLLTTRDMLARISDPGAAGVVGWVSESEGNAIAVTYYDAGPDGPRAVYRGRVLGARVTNRETFLDPAARPPLSPTLARMAKARAAAEALELQACTGDFNLLVVPPANPRAPIDVYHLSAQTDRGRVPIGGHFRSTVDAGGDVTETRAFTNRCLDADAPAPAEGAPPAPIAVVHLLDPVPTEIHAFLAASGGRPLVVVTGDGERDQWLVTPEAIARLRP
jgi:hypothetical protein